MNAVVETLRSSSLLAGLSLDALEAVASALDAWQGSLRPHFAYGTLTKAQYERAHAMHIANHLSTLSYPP